MSGCHYNHYYPDLDEAIEQAIKQTSPFSAYYAIVYYDPVERAHFIATDYELVWPERVHPDRLFWLQERLQRSREVWNSDGKPLFA